MLRNFSCSKVRLRQRRIHHLEFHTSSLEQLEICICTKRSGDVPNFNKQWTVPYCLSSATCKSWGTHVARSSSWNATNVSVGLWYITVYILLPSPLLYIAASKALPTCISQLSILSLPCPPPPLLNMLQTIGGLAQSLPSIRETAASTVAHRLPSLTSWRTTALPNPSISIPPGSIHLLLS
jgi:hypothetical protein